LKQYGFKLTYSIKAKDKDAAVEKFIDDGQDLHEAAGSDMHELTEEEIKEYGV